MKIVVAVSRVPEAPPEARIDPDTLRLDNAGTSTVLNPVDAYAIETARQLKAEHDAHVTVLHVGPAEAESVVRDALAYGLDDAVQVVDEAAAGSDAIATARIIAAAVQRISPDIALFAGHTIDGRTSLVPPAVAEFLGWTALTRVGSLRFAADTLHAGLGHDGGLSATSTVPTVVSVAEGIYEPAFPSFKGVLAAKSAPYETWSLADIEVAPDMVGAEGSAAQVRAVEARPPRTRGTVLDDDGSGSSVDDLIDFLDTSAG